MKHKNFLDEFFKNKNKKDILYIHIIAIFLIGFIIYYFIYPLSGSFQEREENNYKHNIQTLNNLNNKKNLTKLQIIKLNRYIKKLSSQKIVLHKQKQFFDQLVSLLDFAEFDKYKWVKYVKYIVYDSKNEGLQLIDFKNDLINDTNESHIVNKKMSIVVNLKGKYKNLISYLYKYENTKELLRADEIKINDKGEFMIKYFLYGYEK
jgi:hypothetical protein